MNYGGGFEKVKSKSYLSIHSINKNKQFKGGEGFVIYFLRLLF